MRLGFLVIFGFFLWNYAKAQKSSSISPIKSTIDSVRKFVYPLPSSDLLPPDFNSPALENVYYCYSTHYYGHIFALTLRDNYTFIYETFYKPYSYTRIGFRIGTYNICGDTLYLTYTSLLPGKPGTIYLSPTLSVSWVQPGKFEFLLLNKDNLLDPTKQKRKKRIFFVPTETPQFDLESCR